MLLNENRGNVIGELDPRMKLLIMLACTVCTFLSADRYALMLNYALILVLFFAAGLFRKGVKVFIYVAVLLLLDFVSPYIANEQLRNIAGALLYFVQRFSAIIIMAIWVAGKTRIGDFITAMENMHAPKGITITLAVAFRYIPTVKQEFYYIKNTMKLRGIGITPKNIVLRPLKTIEYAIVPLIIRYFTIADELSASAMTRGLDLETKRVSYREIKLKAGDYLSVALFTCAAVSISIFS